MEEKIKQQNIKTNDKNSANILANITLNLDINCRQLRGNKIRSD